MPVWLRDSRRRAAKCGITVLPVRLIQFPSDHYLSTYLKILLENQKDRCSTWNQFPVISEYAVLLPPGYFFVYHVPPLLNERSVCDIYQSCCCLPDALRHQKITTMTPMNWQKEMPRSGKDATTWWAYPETLKTTSLVLSTWKQKCNGKLDFLLVAGFMK